MQRRGLLMGDKKGLSDVVTSVLLILLVLAGVAIMWVVIRQFISGTTAQLDSSVITTSFTILPGASAQTVNSVVRSLKFNVRREAVTGSPAQVVALNVIVTDVSGAANNQRYEIPGGNFDPLSTQTITLTNIPNIQKVKSIEVVPVIRSVDGSEKQASSSSPQVLQDADQLYLPQIIAWYGFDETSWATSGTSTTRDQVSGIDGTVFFGTPANGQVVPSTSDYIFGTAAAKFVNPSTSTGVAFIQLPNTATGQTAGAGLGLDAPSATGNALTLSAWIRPTDDYAQAIFGGYTGTAGYGLAMNLKQKGKNNLDAYGNGNQNWKESALNVLEYNKWNFVAVTVPNVGTSCTFYVNGQKVGNLDNTACPGPITTHIGNRKIGGLLTTSTCTQGTLCRSTSNLYEFDGSIDEFMIFKKELTETEIRNIYSYFNARRVV